MTREGLKNLFALDSWQQGTAPLAHQLHGVYSILQEPPRVQTLLREEVLGVPTSSPSMEDLDKLPYLESVIKETMRLHGPVSMSARIAEKDDVIPLSEPFIDRYGEIRNCIEYGVLLLAAIPILTSLW